MRVYPNLLLSATAILPYITTSSGSGFEMAEVDRPPASQSDVHGRIVSE